MLTKGSLRHNVGKPDTTSKPPDEIQSEECGWRIGVILVCVALLILIVVTYCK